MLKKCFIIVVFQLTNLVLVAVEMEWLLKGIQLAFSMNMDKRKASRYMYTPISYNDFFSNIKKRL